MGFAEIGAEPSGVGEVVKGPIEITAGTFPRPEPVVSLPGIGIGFERVGPEGVLVGEDMRVAERPAGQPGQEEACAGHRPDLERLPSRGKPRRPRRAQRHNDADERHVVEVVGDPGDPHVGDGDETEDREDHEKEEPEPEQRVPGRGRRGRGSPS